MRHGITVHISVRWQYHAHDNATLSGISIHSDRFKSSFGFFESPLSCPIFFPTFPLFCVATAAYNYTEFLKDVDV